MAGDDWEFRDVVSSNLSQVGFNAKTRQGRGIFLNSADYLYGNCTEEEFTQIVNAASAGEMFNALWGRGGKKPYQRIA
jgi:hypothetical protein